MLRYTPLLVVVVVTISLGVSIVLVKYSIILMEKVFRKEVMSTILKYLH